MTGAQAIAGKLERERIRLMIAGAMSSTALTNPMMGCLVVWSATIMRGGLPDRPYKTWEVWDAPTPAIAIVIASLRARNEGEG